MFWKRLLLAWTTLLALALAPASATARASVIAKTHVGVIDVAANLCIEAASSASLGEYRENRLAEYDGTSDVPHAARGVAAAKVCFRAGTLVASPEGAVAIEELRVGDRVETLPGGVETAVDSTWRIVKLTLADEHEPDHLFAVELLRSPEWFKVRNLTGPGDRFFLELEEMEVSGFGTVESIQDAPEIVDGSGRVVLMTVNHVNSDVYELSFEGVVENLHPTGAHPLYSLDRHAWVPVRDLVVGERLQTASGAISITALDRIRGEYRVYNIEVEGDHEYLVSEERVRAHNQCRGLWQITKEGTDRAVAWGSRTISRHKTTGLWWSKDTAGHGGSAWKVFKEEAGGLRFFRDADKYGDFIVGKHKGPVGEFIPWKSITGK